MKILVAMSGGVDSTAAALLLKRQGHDVAGATLDLLPENGNKRDIEDAAAAAAAIGIPHYVFDLKDVFAEKVIGNFCAEYVRGRTPNPCVQCNMFVKFGAMARMAAELGYGTLATGHYARVCRENGRYFIRRASDAKKDQSYVLYGLTQEQLAHVVFPLADMTKEEIRALAAEAGLNAATRRDSQDICFIKDGDYAGYLCKKQGVVPVPGDFVDADGNPLGRHDGVIYYTVGQRKGLGVTFGEPRYVVAKNAVDNTVTLGKNEDLFVNTVRVRELKLQKLAALDSPVRVTAKTRYSQRETPALLFPDGEGAALEFDSPVRAPAPGQSAVFYDGDDVVGGGIII